MHTAYCIGIVPNTAQNVGIDGWSVSHRCPHFGQYRSDTDAQYRSDTDAQYRICCIPRIHLACQSQLLEMQHFSMGEKGREGGSREGGDVFLVV